jgi:hypothetical protein
VEPFSDTVMCFSAVFGLHDGSNARKSKQFFALD